MAVFAGFQELAARLVSHLNEVIRRGEISERGLARLTGYSQPHIHNVLKGARTMTPELADQVMAFLAVPLLSLFTQEELSGRAPPRPADALPVSLLRGRLGGGKAFPRVATRYQSRFFPASVLAGLVNPALAFLDMKENSMWPALWPNDLVLLDRSPRVRRGPLFEHVYALSWRNRGYIGRCRVVGHALVVVVDNTREGVKGPQTISLDNRNVLDVVRGKIVWLGRDLDVVG